MIRIKLETITPEKAKEYLKTNNGNRRLSMAQVESLAREIREDRWQVTHQGIAFDEDGVLIDGQHRLHAVVRADKSVDMMVAHGVQPSENNLYAIDNGRKRSVCDALKIGNYDPLYTSPQVIGAIQAFFMHKGNRTRNDRLSAEEVAKYIAMNEAGVRVLHGFIQIAKNSSKISNANLYCALYSAYLAGEKEEDIKSFLRCYARNEIDGRYNCKAALDLADYLKRYKIKEAEVVERAENAIYRYIHNVKRANTANRYKAKNTWFFPIRVDMDK